MRQNCSDKVEGQTDAGDNAQERPKYPQHQAQCASKFPSCKKGEVTQRKADDFVNCSYHAWVMANLRNS